MKGVVYILECANGKFYTGSTNDLAKRFQEHQMGMGAIFTRKHLPVKLVYVKEFDRIDLAFEREKQIQGWSRKKKQALIEGDENALHLYAECQNASHSSTAYFRDFKKPNDYQENF